MLRTLPSPIVSPASRRGLGRVRLERGRTIGYRSGTPMAGPRHKAGETVMGDAGMVRP